MLVKIFVTCFGVFIVLLFIVASRFVFVKKQIFLWGIDQTKSTTSFDYIPNFNGNWILMTIDYDFLLKEQSADKDLRLKIEEVRRLRKLMKGLGIFILICLVLGKTVA